MKVLVTGGAGFIGSHVVEHFQSRAEVRVLDNFRTGYAHNLTGLDCEILEGSITDAALVQRAMSGIDMVFHLAALVSVPESMERVSECVDINVSGLLNVLSAAREAGTNKLVFASSAAVYGENPQMPKRENMIPEPRSPYAITKLDGEFYCDLYARESWLPTACLRFFNVFGPRQDPKGAYAAAVPIFIEKALSGKTLDVHGDGEQTRDFIYVKDIVSALVFCAENPQATGVFNCGYGSKLSLNALIKHILTATGSQSEVRMGEARAGDIRHSLASVQKLQAAGWQPAIGFERGLADTLASFRERSG